MQQVAGARAAAPASILILGAAKSGTTGLFYAVRSALAERLGMRVEGLFEPRTWVEIRDYLRSSTDDVRLVKALLGVLVRGGPMQTDLFEKRVVIFRDPRDNIVSRLVFMLPKILPLSEPRKVEAVLDLLRRKESEPGSLSVVDIIRQISRVSGREDLLANMRANALLPARIKREHEGAFFFMPYDDLVAENFAPLSEYLGVPIGTGFAVDQKHAYVVRSKESGGWRHWFLDEDVRYFATEVAEDYRLLGFDPEEMPASERRIAPETCSRYAQAQIERVREKRRKQRAARRERERAWSRSAPAAAG